MDSHTQEASWAKVRALKWLKVGIWDSNFCINAFENLEALDFLKSSEPTEMARCCLTEELSHLPFLPCWGTLYHIKDYSNMGPLSICAHQTNIYIRISVLPLELTSITRSQVIRPTCKSQWNCYILQMYSCEVKSFKIPQCFHFLS